MVARTNLPQARLLGLVKCESPILGQLSIQQWLCLGGDWQALTRLITPGVSPPGYLDMRYGPLGPSMLEADLSRPQRSSPAASRRRRERPLRHRIPGNAGVQARLESAPAPSAAFPGAAACLLSGTRGGAGRARPGQKNEAVGAPWPELLIPGGLKHADSAFSHRQLHRRCCLWRQGCDPRHIGATPGLLSFKVLKNSRGPVDLPEIPHGHWAVCRLVSGAMWM